MNRVSPKAVALSFLLVLLLDALAGVGLLVFHAHEIFVGGHSEEQMSQALEAVMTSASFLSSAVLLGALTTAVGGFAVARMAKRFPYVNGLALGILGGLFGLAFWSEYPLWFNLVALAAAIPATLLGAHMAARQGRAQASGTTRSVDGET